MIKRFSSYNINDIQKERDMILEFAKKRNSNYQNSIKKPHQESIEKENNEIFSEKIPDEVFCNNLISAEENNKKFSNKLNTYSSIEEIIDTLFEKN